MSKPSLPRPPLAMSVSTRSHVSSYSTATQRVVRLAKADESPAHLLSDLGRAGARSLGHLRLSALADGLGGLALAATAAARVIVEGHEEGVAEEEVELGEDGRVRLGLDRHTPWAVGSDRGEADCTGASGRAQA